MKFDNDNENDDSGTATVFIIIGQVNRQKGGEKRPFHVLIVAPDEDTAVRHCLDALSAKGFAEADLNQIGLMGGMPDEEPHASAYQGALEGEVAVIAFD
ncbi:transcriptional regulator [Hoeflea sp. G2-23]|uniref:Transcriptional regulator n=1 Tax=Hoeflea algicola TaxID=2983763 RepID=A0ABT3Z4B2_9HYPH|nr:transcriptional regulator [Hoeflea algicola]MCY0146605.1 transcriptional regulator [Hoeflea algicola]